ncbi:MAG TPA: VOC family protein [Streptosporangiaceae bacterium]|jgi:catechol 2,3-dioxygenase-like lactoylglutathione lyase family enzyme|nr:VOC family protein [Streptosporangiaceae bacterium]
MNATHGLPGLRGGDHIGITVPDLEQATTFFVDVLGAEQFYDLGPMASDTDWMTVHLGVAPDARVERLRFFRLGSGLNVEVFEYTAPGQRTSPPLNSDIGGHHLALYVDDMDKAVRYLSESGIEVMGEPTVRTSGPSAGQSWVYFRAPWGLQLELVSYPGGKGYERETDRRLWDPRNPAA